MSCKNIFFQLFFVSLNHIHLAHKSYIFIQNEKIIFDSCGNRFSN